MKTFETKFKIGETKLELSNIELNEKVKKELAEFEMAVKELNFDKAITLRNNLGNLFKGKKN